MTRLFQGRPFWAAVAALILGVVLAGCSEQVAGVGTGGTGSYTMGGSIQGKELALINEVTTIAGTASTVAGTPDWADGTGAEARFDQPTDITTDGINLYVVDSGKHTIRKIEIATGVVTTLAGSPGISGAADGIGSAASFNSPQGITTDGAYLYVADSGNSTIRKIEISTGVVTTLAGSAQSVPGGPQSQGSTDGAGSTARFAWPTGITTDGTNLYVVDLVNHTIRKIVISTGDVSTIAGTAGISGSTDGTGTAALFLYPQYITTDGTNLYLTDSGNLTIRKIEIATGVVSTLAGTAEAQGSIDGNGAAARFFFLRGITSYGTNLYVSDLSSIRKINILTGAVTTMIPTETSGTTPRSFFPTGITTDGLNLYVVDSGNKRIRSVELSANTVTTLAGSPPVVDGTGAAVSFSGPVDITTDGVSLFVTDKEESIIRKIDIATGKVSTLAGTPHRTGATDGIGAAATFYFPTGITTDGISLFVTDSVAHVIRKIEISTSTVTTLAGTPWSSGSSDGIGAAARFNIPYGITTDGKYLYVTEGPNNTIRKVEISTGVVTTLAITVGPPWSADPDGLGTWFVDRIGITTDGTYLYVADGQAIRKIEISTGIVTTFIESADFEWINGLTADGTNLYVSDSTGTIRKVVIATGEVTTLAGTPGSLGSSNGTGAAARFNFPMGVTTDGKSLYIADYGNNTIRKIQ